MGRIQLVPPDNAESIARDYGSLRRLSVSSAGLKNLQVLRQEILPGAKTSRHRHQSEEVFYLLEGRVVFHGDTGSVAAKAGDSVIVPSETVHQLENMGSETAILIIALSPPRDPSKATYLEDNSF